MARCKKMLPNGKFFYWQSKCLQPAQPPQSKAGKQVQCQHGTGSTFFAVTTSNKVTPKLIEVYEAKLRKLGHVGPEAQELFVGLYKSWHMESRSMDTTTPQGRVAISSGYTKGSSV